MKRSFIFLATGFEEVEAVATIDILRRARMDVTVVSISKDRIVTGAHGITVAADVVMAGADFTDADWLICPGGLPGAKHLADDAELTQLLKNHYASGGHIAAICASPAMVLAPLGILKNRKATAYPGCEASLIQGGAASTGERATVDGNVITGNGPASTFAFGLAIVRETLGEAKAKEVADGMLYNL